MQSHLVDLTLSACSVAKDEVTHAIDGLINGSQLALVAVRKCEERLDSMDREMDEELATVITQVTPLKARELLACMKLMLDLERVGDLVASFSERSAIVRNRIDMDDIEQLTRMGCLLENMLSTMVKAFATRNIEQALPCCALTPRLTACATLLWCATQKMLKGSRVRRACTCWRWPMPWSAPAITSRTWLRNSAIWPQATPFAT